MEEFVADNVKLVRADEHKGKEYAQLQAIKVAQGKILVFPDVAGSSSFFLRNYVNALVLPTKGWGKESNCSRPQRDKTNK